MKLYFCDLCNESVPHGDLETGKAFIRKSRVVCASCDAAMSAALASQAPMEGAASGEAAQAPGSAASSPLPAALHAPHLPGRRRSAGFEMAGLWLGLLALLISAGTVMYVLEEQENTRTGLEEALGSIRGELRDSLADSDARAAEEREAQRLALEAIGARIDAGSGELEGRFALLQSAVDSRREDVDTLRAEFAQVRAELERGVKLQDGQLQDFDERMARARDELRFFGERLTELELQVLRGSLAAEPVSGIEPAAGGPAWQGLLGDLASEESDARWAAVQALGETGDVEVAPHVSPLLKDPDIFVRMATARVLGDLGARSAVPALIDALEDAEPAVQEAAVGSLRRISGREFGFEIDAPDKERARRVQAWRDWWKKEGAQEPAEDAPPRQP